MKDELISIGQMAKMNNTTVPALRLYDRMGILSPRFVDPDSGYRYYSIQQNARLDMIGYMKELGMSLKEISSILRSGDITLIETMLAQKNEQIHQQIRHLRMRHDAVERTIANIERYRKSPDTGTIALEYIDRRYIYGIPCVENFYDHDISSYEKVLAVLRRDLMDRNVPQMHTYNIGTSVKREDFDSGRLIADKVFIFADRYMDELGLELEIVDSGMYACIYLDDYDNETEYAGRLLAFCRDREFSITGDYICEVLTEFNVFDDEQRGMFLRLQVPLGFSSRMI